MKGINLCGECGFYDFKNHKCRRGANKETNPKAPFYDDCPLEEAAPVVRSWKTKAVLDPGAIMPTRAHPNDAGLDLYATKGGWIFPKCRRTFGTGTHVAIPEGYVGLLTSKSGMMQKMGVTSRGTIDSDYTGEIRAVLFNHSWKFVKILPWQKITQLVILPIITPDLELVESLDKTERGNGGFGSTGAF